MECKSPLCSILAWVAIIFATQQYRAEAFLSSKNLPARNAAQTTATKEVLGGKRNEGLRNQVLLRLSNMRMQQHGEDASSKRRCECPDDSVDETNFDEEEHENVEDAQEALFASLGTIWASTTTPYTY